jgi:branched-chain amino acid transport system permease protein
MRRSDGKQAARLLWVVASTLCLAALVLAPAMLSMYWIRVLTSVFLYATLAQAINLIAGYTGYPAFGNVVFFGLGAYGTGVAMVHYQLPFVAGMAIGAGLCAAIALVVGPAMFRLRGHYFAMGTLGLNEAVRAVVENVDATGGGRGLSLPLFPGGIERSATTFYVLFLLMAVAALLLSWMFVRSRFGYACRAIREDEVAAESLGVATTRTKTAVWTISAVVTGACGAVNAYWLGHLDPGSAFSIGIAIKFFLMMLVGGAGTLAGPLIGAASVELAATTVWSRFTDYHVGALGLIIIVVVLLFPGGLTRVLRRRLDQMGLGPGAAPT